MRNYTPKLICNGRKHVNEVGGFFQHLKFGSWATFWVGAIFITSIIHIIIPYLFPFIAEEWTIQLASKIMTMRGWTITKNNVQH